MPQALYWAYVTHLTLHRSLVSTRLSTVFCALRVYAIWDRQWSVFWAIMLLYIGHTALFLVRLFLSSPTHLIPILVETPTLLSDFAPFGPPFYGCKMEPKMMLADEVMQ